MPLLQYDLSAHSDERNTQTTPTISPPTTIMEQDLRGIEPPRAGHVRACAVPYLTMTQLFQASMQTAEWFDEPGDHPVERIMRVIQLIIHFQEQYWTENEVVGAFLFDVQQALTKNSEAPVITQAIWDPNHPPSTAAFHSTIDIVSTRLRLACQALNADDPQLAMSIIMWRTLRSSEYDEYSREEIPLSDPLGSQRSAQPNTRLLLVDSPYCKYRFPVTMTELGNFVGDILYVSRSGPDGFLRPIPDGVLQGVSNHEAREQRFRSYEADLHVFIGEMSIAGIPIYEQQHHLGDLALSWANRARDPEYISWRLPPPILPDSPMFFRQLDATNVAELISNEVRWLHAVVDAQEPGSPDTHDGERDWIDTDSKDGDTEHDPENGDHYGGHAVCTLRCTETTYLGEHDAMDIDSGLITNEHCGPVANRPLDPLTREIIDFIAENYEPEVWSAMLRRVNSAPARIPQSAAVTRSDINIESLHQQEPTGLDPDDSVVWDEGSQHFIYFRKPRQAAILPHFALSTPQLPGVPPNTLYSPQSSINSQDEPLEPTDPSFPSRPPISPPRQATVSTPATAGQNLDQPSWAACFFLFGSDGSCPDPIITNEPVDPTAPLLSSRLPTSYPSDTTRLAQIQAIPPSNRLSTPPHLLIQQPEDQWPNAPRRHIRQSRSRRPSSPLQEMTLADELLAFRLSSEGHQDFSEWMLSKEHR